VLTPKLATLHLLTLLSLCSCIDANRGSGPSTEGLSARVSALEDADLDTRVNSLEAAVLDAQLGTIEADLASLDASLTALATEVSDNAAAITTNGAGIVTNSGDIEVLQGDLASLDSETQGLAGDIGANTANITVLGSNLVSIEDQVDDNVPVRTTLVYNGYMTGNASQTFSQLRILGTFTKVAASTDIQLIWSSHVSGSAGGGSCSFQPRIDGSESGNGYGAVIANTGTIFSVAVPR
jgi:hypothetical protein